MGSASALSEASAGTARRGFSAATLAALLTAHGEGAVPAAVRRAALERFDALPAPGPAPGRYWRADLSKLDYGAIVPFTAAADQRPVLEVLDSFARAAWFVQVDSHVLSIDCQPELARRGVIVTSLPEAARSHPDLLRAVFGTVADPGTDKLASLALAFSTGGAFVHVPAGVRIEDPIVVTYVARSSAVFPYTLVSVGEGSAASVIEHVICEDRHGFVSGIVEAVAADRATVTVASVQDCASDARIFAFRRARTGTEATARFALAELGGAYVRSDVRARLDQPGARAEIAGLFFPGGTQHVDVTTQIDHAVGPTSSDTVVKNAAIERGQARYLGNIAIASHAHGCEATLRDDALLLSASAHIDSIPALEIAANDVRAFHGATVGAIDADAVFYAMSRGIPRVRAERMIALGFFEPAVAAFPTEGLRAHLRAVLETKIADPSEAEAAA